MKLPNLPFLDKKPKVEYFLTLLLRDEKATAVVVEQTEGKITIISKHEEVFPTALEDASNEELLQVLDKTISWTEGTLPPDIELQNTVFGVKDTWVEDKKIKKEYLSKLKHVCDQLNLTPMGFIVLAEAITHLIQTEEGAPFSGLLTEIGTQTVTVSLFRAGKLVEARHAPMVETPMKSVDNLLKAFDKVELLPSRIVLFNARKTDENAKVHDDLTQKFIAHQWSKGLPFLHVPQISILPAGFDGKAVVAGAAEQLGFEMAGLSVDTKDIDIKTYEKHHLVKTEKVVEKELEENEKFEESEQSNDENSEDGEKLEHVKTDNFGFVVDQDITMMPPVEKGEKAEKHPETHHAKKVVHAEPEPVHHPAPADEDEEADETFEEPERKKKPQVHILSLFSGLFLPFKGMRQNRLPKLPLGNRLMIIPPAILVLLIGLVVLYIYQLKATVTLVVSPRMVDEAEKLTFSTTSGNDFSAGILAAKDVSVTLEGSSTTPATGQKEVGEKAKGTVTIYNSETSKKTLKEGTTVSSSNGLVYLLDKEVSIASASGDIFTGIKSGTAQVAVTAKAIGNEYNLPSNSKFSVEGSSSLAAKNDAAFSGGSKKKVTVVAKKDIDKLTQELPKSLEQKAKSALQEKLSADEELLAEFSSVTLEKKTASADIDEEAKEVKLTASVTFASAAYQKQDILQYAQSLLKNRFSQDQTIPEQHIITSVGGLKQKNETEVTGLLEIKAGLLPKLDNPKITKEITGKSYADVDAYIKKLPQVQRADIVLSPNIPFLPKMLPRMEKNITVVVQPSE